MMILIFLLQILMAHEVMEFKDNGVANKFAFGKFVDHTPKASWPYPLLSIGHNMQQYQNYSNYPYWHDGLDIRSKIHEPIYASRGGKVVNVENYRPGNPLYWEVAILDVYGLVWKYHHVDPDSIPEKIKKAFKNGESIPDGEFIGNVIEWPISTMGEIYHHLHLLIVDKDQNYINPFLVLEDLNDQKAPEIIRVGLQQNKKIKNDQRSIKNPVGIYLNARDLALHEKFYLPPHKIEYQIDNGDWVTAVEFKTLFAKNDEDFIEDFYLEPTCGNYRCRDFTMNLFFSPQNTMGHKNFSPGRHEIKIRVSDQNFNQSEINFDFEVRE
jgi:hypothetical protein